METRVKWNALFNKWGASTSEPFREIKCIFEQIKNHRENQRNQKDQRGQGNNLQNKHREHQTNKTFRPMSAKVDTGLKVLLFVGLFGFLYGFASCSLDLFGYFVVLLFSLWLLMFSNLCIVCLSMCLETVKQTCLWYKGFTFVRDFPW